MPCWARRRATGHHRGRHSSPPPLAQDKPANVRAANGANVSEAIVSWDAVDNAAFYRIGWVAFADIETVQAAGRHWLDAFAFTDVANLTQTTTH